MVRSAEVALMVPRRRGRDPSTSRLRSRGASGDAFSSIHLVKCSNGWASVVSLALHVPSVCRREPGPARFRQRLGAGHRPPHLRPPHPRSRAHDVRRARRARRHPRRAGLDAREARRRVHPAGPDPRRPADRTDRSEGGVQPGPPLHRRHLLRLRARQAAGQHQQARRVPQRRRPVHVDHGHVPEPADGLLLRDEPRRADGRRADGAGRHQQPRVGRHLERARPAERDRLDHRDRHPLPIDRVRSQRSGMGHQLPAHGPPQAGRADVDGLPAQPGPAPHGQCRTADRAQGSELGQRVRAEAVRVGLRRRCPRPHSRHSARRQRRHRRRGGLQRDAEPQGGGHDQHRLRRDRGRSAPRQSHAVPVVLPGEAQLLPRRRHVLRLPDHRVLLPPHRPRQRSAATHCRRRQDDRAGRQQRHRRAVRAYRRKTTTCSRRRRISSSAAGGVACCSSPTSGPSIPAGRPTPTSPRRCVRRWARTSAWRRRRSTATRT